MAIGEEKRSNAYTEVAILFPLRELPKKFSRNTKCM